MHSNGLFLIRVKLAGINEQQKMKPINIKWVIEAV